MHVNNAREAFEGWVFDGQPEVALVEIGNGLFESYTAAGLLAGLAECPDVMPGALSQELDLEQGTSYGEAARAVKGRPTLPLRLPPLRRN